MRRLCQPHQNSMAAPTFLVHACQKTRLSAGVFGKCAALVFILSLSRCGQAAAQAKAGSHVSVCSVHSLAVAGSLFRSCLRGARSPVSVVQSCLAFTSAVPVIFQQALRACPLRSFPRSQACVSRSMWVVSLAPISGFPGLLLHRPSWFLQLRPLCHLRRLTCSKQQPAALVLSWPLAVHRLPCPRATCFAPLQHSRVAARQFSFPLVPARWPWLVRQSLRACQSSHSAIGPQPSPARLGSGLFLHSPAFRAGSGPALSCLCFPAPAVLGRCSLFLVRLWSLPTTRKESSHVLLSLCSFRPSALQSRPNHPGR